MTPALLELASGGLRLRIDTLSAQPFTSKLQRPARFRVDPAEAYGGAATPPPVLFEEVDYLLTVEADRHDAKVEFRCTDGNFLRGVDKRTTHPVWQGPFKFRGYVGDFVLEVLLDGHPRLCILLEVFPTKLDYREDYEKLLESIAEHERTLPFRLVAPTTVTHELRDELRSRSSEAEWLAVLRWQKRHLLRALQAIAANPHHELRREALMRPAALVRQASGRSGAWLARHPQYARRDGFPERLIDERRLITIDTAENRYVIGRTRTWLRRLARLLSGHDRLRGEFSEVERALREFASGSPLAPLESGPEPRSHVVQHNHAYRRLAQIDRWLRRAAERAAAGQVPVTLKSLPILYEYWVLLAVHAILIKELSFRCDQSGPAVVLAPSAASLQPDGHLAYSRDDGAKASLWYQGLFLAKPDDDEDDAGSVASGPSGLKSLTASQHPDGVLVLQINQVSYPVRVIIDAKYKVGRGGRGPRVADVNTMHRYRDALLADPDGGQELAYGVTRSWFVYPGSTAALPLDPGPDLPASKDPAERLWHAALRIGVGAIPALPGREHLLASALRTVAGASPGALESSRPRTPHLSPLRLEEDAACLLAVVPDESRLEQHVATRLYHMPEQKLAGEASSVRFLVLGVRGWRAGVRVVGYPSFFFRCRHVGTVPRDKLPEHYLATIGPTQFRRLPNNYHLFELHERFELSGPTTSLPVPGVSDLFVRTTVREALRLLS